jgi:CRISPR-associated endonuclease Cas2
MSRQAASARQWLLAYDVHSPRRRSRLAALLEAHGVRVQRSVFSSDCTQHELVSVLRQAEGIVESGDRVAAWPVVQRAPLPAAWQRRQRQARVPHYWVV